MREQRRQRLAVGRLQGLQHPRLRTIDRGHDVAQQRRARPGLIKQLYAFIAGGWLALDIALRLQPLDHVAQCRAVERDHGGKPRRVDAGMGVDRDQGCKLHRRQVVVPALLHEDRDRDLLHPSKQIARRGVDRVHGHGGWFTRHRAVAPGRRRRTP